MNHVYRLVWNRAMRMWQPVSELAAQPRGGAAPAAVYAPVRWRLHAVAAALGLGLAGWGPAAQAACSVVGLTVMCSGAASPLSPTYANGSDGLNLTLTPGAGVGTLLGVGGTAMALSGGNVSVTNNGKIDVYALGTGLGVLSSGLIMGQPEATTAGFGTYTVENNATGLIRGSSHDTYFAQAPNLTGMALSIHNGTGGVTNVTNNGTIDMKALASGSRISADMAAVAIYGGGVANFTNGIGGTINGRVAFESAGALLGNRFTNAGAINGSVSMGANSKNAFIAESGSSISAQGLTTGTISITAVPGLLFAKPGTVDGGAGGANSLTFADTANQGLTTSVAAGTYLNFNSLTVTGGTWSLSGGPVMPAGSSIALNGGTVLVDASGGLGSGAINAGGGSIGASAAGEPVGNTFTLGDGGLTAGGTNDFTLSGVLTGTGPLKVAATGTVTLTGANSFTGGVDIQAGTLALGSGGSLAAGSTVKVGADGEFDISAAANTALGTLNGAAGGRVTLGANVLTLGAGTYDGAITGIGGLTKNTTAALTLNGVNTYSGATQVNAGALWVGGTSADAGARLLSSVTVANGASLGGFGQVTGDVTVRSGGSLAPGAPGGTFTVNGNLTLAQGSQMDYSFGAPGSSGVAGAGHSVQVNGDLALNGTQLNVNDAGGYGAGLYRLFDYTGSLLQANGGITGLAAGQTVQILTASRQINLINSAGLTLNIWNADRTATSTHLGGGSGIWSKTYLNWTDAAAMLNSTFSPANAFAIFGGTAGTVTVDSAAGAITASGVQFASDGYRMNGDALNLVAASGGGLSELRVGNGSAQSANWTATLDNVVAGNGVNKTGLGTLVLNGVNTYAQTRLSAGTLSVSTDANLGAALGGLDFQGGTLRITGTAFQNTARAISLGVGGGGLDIADAGNTFTVMQSLSGNGGLAKLGAGTLVLSGANTYLGTTTVAGGRLQVGDGASAGSITGNADIQSGGTLAFKRSDRVVYGGAISGSGDLRQEGSGTLVLTGDSRAYTGTTTLSAGGLQVDGTLGGTLIAATKGTTVSGIGSLNDLTIGAGVTLAPGNAATPLGRLSVLGNLTMAPDASYRVAALADGQHSGVNVTGIANVAGTVLHMGQNGAYAPSTTYTILTAGGGLLGRFDSVSSDFAFLTPSLAYGSNQVDLTVQLKQVPDNGNGNGGGNDGGTRPIEFADAAFTGNQRSVARALQSLPADSGLFRRVLNLPNGAPADVFDGLSGEVHATTVSVAQGVANSFVQIPMSRLRANLGAGMLPGVPTAQLGLGNAAALPQSAAQPVWAQVFGNWSALSGNGNAARTTQSDSGVSAGGDVALGGGWRLGGAVGYSNSRSSTGDRASSSQADSYSLTVYGGKAFDAGSAKLNLSLGASYTWHEMKAQRYADAAGLPQTLKAEYDGNTSQVFGELGYAMPLTDRVTLEPFVGAGFSSLRTRPFTESGGDAALRGEADRNNVTTATVGLHARSAFESAGAQGQLFGTLGWRHAFGDVNPASTMSFVQGSESFTTNGVPIARDAALVELGVNMAVSKRTTVGVTYGGQFGEGNQQHSGTLDVRYRF